MSAFSDRVAAFLDEYFALHPLSATSAGMHAYDDRWPDVTEAGRIARLAFYDRWTAELEGFAATDLSKDDAIDRDLLVGELAAHRFGDEVLREERWSPLEWVYMLGDGLFTLIAREFAPLATRLESIAGRLEGMPAVLDAAVETIGGTDGRPVSRLHTEKALAQWSGIDELVGQALEEAEGAAGNDPDVAAVLPRLQAAAAAAREKLAALETHLRETVLPASDGEGRLGADLFATKLRHTMRSDELTTERSASGPNRSTSPFARR